MPKPTEIRPKSFLFRGLPQNILIGTASDRYAGWIGQIYSQWRYEQGITRRSHKVGDKTFNEETLPGKWGTFVQRQLLVNRAPVLTLWAVVGEVLGGQRTAPEDTQGRKSDR